MIVAALHGVLAGTVLLAAGAAFSVLPAPGRHSGGRHRGPARRRSRQIGRPSRPVVHRRTAGTGHGRPPHGRDKQQHALDRGRRGLCRRRPDRSRLVRIRFRRRTGRTVELDIGQQRGAPLATGNQGFRDGDDRRAEECLAHGALRASSGRRCRLPRQEASRSSTESASACTSRSVPAASLPQQFTIGAIVAGRSLSGHPSVVAEVHNIGQGTLDVSGTLTLSDGPGGISAGPFPLTLGAPLAPGSTEPAKVQLGKAVPRRPLAGRYPAQQRAPPTVGHRDDHVPGRARHGSSRVARRARRRCDRLGSSLRRRSYAPDRRARSQEGNPPAADPSGESALCNRHDN